MTSLDAIAALFFFFFLIQFILFLMLAWIVKKYVKAIWLINREFQKQSKFWHSRAKKEAFLRDCERNKQNDAR